MLFLEDVKQHCYGGGGRAVGIRIKRKDGELRVIKFFHDFSYLSQGLCRHLDITLI